MDPGFGEKSLGKYNQELPTGATDHIFNTFENFNSNGIEMPFEERQIPIFSPKFLIVQLQLHNLISTSKLCDEDYVISITKL